MNNLLPISDQYQYGFSVPQKYVYKSKPGLSPKIVKEISYHKNEPDWLFQFRLKSLDIFLKKPIPSWGPNLSEIDFKTIHYYIRPTDKKASSWQDLPPEIKDTYDKIGLPEAEKKFLAGVSAQYECLSGDTLIFGPQGATLLKNIKAGMEIFSLNQDARLLEKQTVVGLSLKGVKPVYKVKVAGREISCTENHPFLVLRYSKKKNQKRGKFSVEWDYLKNLSIGDYIAIVKKLPDLGVSYSLPKISLSKKYTGKNQYGSFSVKANWLYTRNQKGLKIPSQTTEDFMYLIGLYLGDGYINRTSKKSAYKIISLAIPKTEKRLRQYVCNKLKSVFNYKTTQNELYRIRIHSYPIVEFFETIGLIGNSHTKKLPDWVFGLPTEQKLAILGGYIDSDGYLRHGKRNCDVLISSVNKKLLVSFQMLAISCGLHVVGIHEIISNSFGKKRITYRLHIAGDLLPLSKCSLKVQEDFSPRSYYHTYNSHHKSSLDNYTGEEIGYAPIKKISPAGKEQVYDIEVNSHHNFTANGIVVHNSEVVYKSIMDSLSKKGVIFVDPDTAFSQYPDIFKPYFGKIVPPYDNKFSALNSSVFSGGSFIYVPKGVHVDLPLQAYFRINAAQMGQFERTLIIAEEESFVHYVEGCTAPVYSTDSLHSAVVEIIVKKNARVRYTTIQNWSKNVYNLVTKRAVVYEDGIMEWVDGNLGSKLTMKYPSCYLIGKGARGDILSLAYAGKNQIQDAGGKIIHAAPNTSSTIVSKSISKDGGRTSYRGLLKIIKGAKSVKANVRCDALILDEKSRSDTYPTMDISENQVTVGHEASVSKIGEEQLFYLQSRGLSENQAQSLIVNGFMEPIVKELPMEYAVEMNRLIQLEMSGSVG